MQPFSPGITHLLRHNSDWIVGQKIALVSHPAAVDLSGSSSAQLLFDHRNVHLTALLGPEHGFLGNAPAGQKITNKRHPSMDIPMYSLYGKTRTPTARMLKDIDTVIFDLQSIPARPYTYLATLRAVLIVAAELGKSVIVADRQIPLPSTIDGPILDPAFESFVAPLAVPMVYGMTPGEAAQWIVDELDLDVDIKVARMTGYSREPERQAGWPPWVSPSPGIKSWETAMCYPATVFTEALPIIDCGRGSGMAFQLIGTPWKRGGELHDLLSACNLRGATFHRHPYYATSGIHKGRLLDGVRLSVTNPDTFKPILTSVSIICALQTIFGRRRLWQSKNARPAFMDKLFGTARPRKLILSDASPREIANTWRSGLRKFRDSRLPCLLYKEL